MSKKERRKVIDLNKARGTKPITAAERTVLQQLLPNQGRYLFLEKVQEVRERLKWSDAEWTLLVREGGEEYIDDRGVKRTVPDGQLVLEHDKVAPKRIDFGEVVTNWIVEELERLEQTTPPKLQTNQMSLYKKFVISKRKEDTEPSSKE